MKLHFEPDLDYQQEAIEAVVDVFRGQETMRTEFTVTTTTRAEFFGDSAQVQTDLGIGNRLELLEDEILRNVRDIQLRNGLPLSEELKKDDYNFTVEMETGTGKTYVYVRTMLELNRRYGFTKFVIVVPSVAIKEGVYKTLQMTEEHFKSLYANEPYDYFTYDSKKLGEVRNFATSSQIQIMIVTVGAINKQDVNNLYKETEKTGGEKPIDLVRATRPIIIVDEPQSVDGGLSGKGREALDRMAPLCTLRYSATHVNTHHMLYRLDAVDAYERGLVKQIEVASLTVQSGFNKPYVKFISAANKRGAVQAKVELDVQQAKTVSRKQVWVSAGDDLGQVAKRDIYDNIIVNNIRCAEDSQFLELSNQTEFLKPGEAVGGADDDALKRTMIARVIREHLDKEMRLRPKGIKVLTLFFIDAVEHYRSYDEDGNSVPGKYAKMFEEEYRKAAPMYQSLFQEVDLDTHVADVHNGYFSIDKKKIAGKTVETFKNTSGRTQADDDTYNLIMKDKERLLDLKTPLKFIFSHSALREGWDNPNVFQICTLREIGTERERRQTIGRGLRLCVNQHGDRLRGHDPNTLTVIANESYEDFAENLQREIEADTQIKFGLVMEHEFANLTLADEEGNLVPLGAKKSQELFDYLKQHEFINRAGKVQDKLRAALKEGTLPLPESVEEHREGIQARLKKLAGRLEVKNADERRTVKTREAVIDSEEFKALWDRIKHKTRYRVRFDNEKLIEECRKAVRDMPPIPKTRVHTRKGSLSISRGGVQTEENVVAESTVLYERDIVLPDLLTELEYKTKLTRRSLVTILKGSKRLRDFAANPQKFLEQVVDAILRQKQDAIVDGIKYQKIGDEAFYAQELFVNEELTGYMKTMLESQKAPHEKIVYQSNVERDFAMRLEGDRSVKVYAKLPDWFKIPTPLGNYNPDWAVLIEQDRTERLYFVVETKATATGTISFLGSDLRGKEAAKILCGKAHFEALAEGVENPARFIQAGNFDDVLTYT